MKPKSPPKHSRTDLASAEARAAERSRLAYRETPSRFTRESILAKRDAAALTPYEVAPLRTVSATAAEGGSATVARDLSHSNAAGSNFALAADKAKSIGAPYRSPEPARDPDDPDEDDDMDGRVAAAQAADLAPLEGPAQSLEDAEEANRRRSAEAYLRPWGSK